MLCKKDGWKATWGRIWTSMTSCCSSLSSGSETVVSQVVFKRAPDTLELEEGIHRYGAWDDICKVGD